MSVLQKAGKGRRWKAHYIVQTIIATATFLTQLTGDTDRPKQP